MSVHLAMKQQDRPDGIFCHAKRMPVVHDTANGERREAWIGENVVQAGSDTMDQSKVGHSGKKPVRRIPGDRNVGGLKSGLWINRESRASPDALKASFRKLRSRVLLIRAMCGL